MVILVRDEPHPLFDEMRAVSAPMTIWWLSAWTMVKERPSSALDWTAFTSDIMKRRSLEIFRYRREGKS
jgi:hypothetical protein